LTGSLFPQVLRTVTVFLDISAKGKRFSINRKTSSSIDEPCTGVKRAKGFPRARSADTVLLVSIILESARPLHAETSRRDRGGTRIITDREYGTLPVHAATK